MTEVAPARSRAQGGFTLLEIMIALAILAVGSVCVLSTFGAALALHMRRDADVRMARVMEETRAEAQAAWDAWTPTKAAPLPPDIKDAAYGRDSTLSYTISFQPVSGQPAGPDGVTGGARAVVLVHREGQDPEKARRMEFLLVRSGFSPADRRGSFSYEKEKAQEKLKTNEAGKPAPK